LEINPETLKTEQRRAAVGARGEIRQLGTAFGQGGQQGVPMGDGLIARNL
jgi:hypothetical protein